MKKIKWIIFIAIVVVGTTAFAAQATTMPGVAGKIQTASMSFFTNIQSMALSLLFKLFAVSFAVKSINMVLKGAQIQDLLGNLARTVIAIGCYVYLIDNADTLLPAIIDSARTLAAQGSGMSIDALNPKDIMSLGIDLQDNMVLAFNQKSGADSFTGAIKNFFPAMQIFGACVMILGAFAAISFNLFLAFCEAYMIVAISPLMFALGASEWTKDNALKPFQSMISIGLKIMVCSLIAAYAIHVAPDWATQLSTWEITNWKPMWDTAFEIFALGILALWAPSKLTQAVLSGGSGLSASDAVQTGGNVGSMVAGAGAAALVAGTGGAAAIAQGSKALAEATKLSPESAGRAVGSALSSLTGGAGGGSVQSPGSGLSGMASSTSGGGQPGGLAGDLAKNMPAYSGPSADSQKSGSASQPTSSIISTDTNIGNAKSAANSSPATGTGANDATTSAASGTTDASASKSATQAGGDATGASVGGASANTAPATDLQKSIAQAMDSMGASKKPSFADHLASIPKFMPQENMVSGAAVSHAHHD